MEVNQLILNLIAKIQKKIQIHMQTIQDRINSYIQEYQDYLYADKDNKCKPLIQQFLKELDELIDINKDTKKEKARLFYLKGRILDSLPHYQKSAEDYLNKSLKLNPVNGDCWNNLAHVLYKKKDFEGAQKAIEMALQNKGKNKVSLRYQSILLRSQGSNPAEKKKNMSESVKLAKQALMLDMKDPVTWFFLGNAYMNNFFANFLKVQELQNAVKAYIQGQKYFKHSHPDLFFNRANAQSYLQDYEKSIQDLKSAELIDPSLKSKQRIQVLEKKLNYIKNCFQRASELKGIKIQQLIKTIPNSIKQQQKIQSVVPLSSLSPRYNPQKMLSLKILSKLTMDGDVPQSYLVIDSSGKLLNVSFFNIHLKLLNQKIKKDQLLQIKDPQLKVVKFGNFQYFSVQVFQIAKVWVNGTKLTKADPNTLNQK